MKKRDWIFVLVSVLFLAIFLFIYSYIKNKDLKDNLSVTCGKIYDYYEDTKGHDNILFEYYVNNIRYDYMKVGGVYMFKDCEKTGWCIGKCYEVEYSSKNPNNSRMNFDKPCDCDSLIIQQGVVITADR